MIALYLKCKKFRYNRKTVASGTYRRPPPNSDPSTPRWIAPIIPAGVVHDGKNVGTGKAKVLANYIVKKGEPVSSPAK